MAPDDPAQNELAFDEDADRRAYDGRTRGLGTTLGVVVVALLVAWAVYAQTTVVPDIVGLGEPAAEHELDTAGLELGKVTEVASSVHEVGCIARQAPVVGARVFKGSSIDIALARSSGDDGTAGVGVGLTPLGYAPDSERITAVGSGNKDGGGGIARSGPWVPNVQALTQREARARLNAAGYTVAVEFGPVTTGPGKGKVYFQDPEPDAVAARGTLVTIWVSTGGPGVGNGALYVRPYTQPTEQ